MGWRELIGDLLMKLGDSKPEVHHASDPWNYVLAHQLHNSNPGNPTLVQQALAVFPALSQVEATAILEQLKTVHEFAFEVAGQVNDGSLTSNSAANRIKEAFPQIDSENLGRLLMRNLVDTR